MPEWISFPPRATAQTMGVVMSVMSRGRVIASAALLIGLSGCSYYVDMPPLSNEATPLGTGLVCDAFPILFSSISDGVRYVECTREKLISKRDRVDFKRSLSNHVIGAGAAGAAVGALFNAGRSAIIGSGLGAGAGLAYGQVVNFTAYEGTYNAGIMALDCLASDSTRVLSAYQETSARLKGLSNKYSKLASLTPDPEVQTANQKKSLSFDILSSRADARGAAFAESMRQRSNEIVTAVNEQIREDLPKPEKVMAAFGGLAGNMNSLPKPRNEPPYPETIPGLDASDVAKHEAALKNAIDDASDGVCPALEPFAVNMHSVTLNYGQTETVTASVPATGGWVGGDPKGVDWSPKGTGMVNGVSTTTRGFSMTANGSDVVPGTYYFTVISADPKKPGSINVKVRIPDANAGGVCSVPPMDGGKAKPKAPKMLEGDEKAAKLNIDQALYIQKKLKVKVDGTFGPATRDAIKTSGFKFEGDGHLTRVGLAALLGDCANLPLK